MARPRVFIASTHNDLRFVRSAMPDFIESLGYEAVLSDRGNIAFVTGLKIDESCYREVATCDIFVLIIGREYGSSFQRNAGKQKESPPKDKLSHVSVTVGEYQAALERGMPVYVLVEKSVYFEYQTWLRNVDKPGTRYAYVESTNVFHFIKKVLDDGKPVHEFEKFVDIEAWLREQWAGYFQMLLSSSVNNFQFSSLASQIKSLTELNNTLKTYLEEVVKQVSPDVSVRLIASEEKRLVVAKYRSGLRENRSLQFLSTTLHVDAEKVENALKAAPEPDAFWEALCTLPGFDSSQSDFESLIQLCDSNPKFRREIDDARLSLDEPPYYFLRDFDFSGLALPT